ncbi:MAG: hypothetical protein ACYS8W_17710 [Planctomycetota bacterium]|jgi:hypothetical protein
MKMTAITFIVLSAACILSGAILVLAYAFGDVSINDHRCLVAREYGENVWIFAIILGAAGLVASFIHDRHVRQKENRAE